MSKADLRVDWCSYEAAKFAVEHWHYSKRMPMPPLVALGAWEDGVYIGAVLFGRGANYAAGNQYGLTQLQACELVRVALRGHVSPVSRIVSIAVKMLRRQSPELRLIISYADSDQNHHGGIYQAMNWLYVGRGAPTTQFLHDGRWKHNREITSGAFGGARKVKDYSSLPKRVVVGKHKYLYPLDDAMRKQIEPLRKPYPKREPAAGAADVATDDQSGKGGLIPTPPLHSDVTGD